MILWRISFLVILLGFFGFFFEDVPGAFVSPGTVDFGHHQNKAVRIESGNMRRGTVQNSVCVQLWERCVIHTPQSEHVVKLPKKFQQAVSYYSLKVIKKNKRQQQP